MIPFTPIIVGNSPKKKKILIHRLLWNRSRCRGKLLVPYTILLNNRWKRHKNMEWNEGVEANQSFLPFFHKLLLFLVFLVSVLVCESVNIWFVNGKKCIFKMFSIIKKYENIIFLTEEMNENPFRQHIWIKLMVCENSKCSWFDGLFKKHVFFYQNQLFDSVPRFTEGK